MRRSQMPLRSVGLPGGRRVGRLSEKEHTAAGKDQAETTALFELISARYERRSLLITANQPFGEWGKVLPNPAMTLAAVDRLMQRHHL